MNDEFTLDRLRLEVADLLDVDAAAVDDDVALPDQGLDSLRLMTLTERLRSCGAQVAYAELAERPTLRAWSALLDSRPGRRV